MKSTSKKKEIPTNFPDIQTAEQLKIYLDDSTNRLKNSRFLYHYTTVSNAIKILRSKTANSSKRGHMLRTNGALSTF